MYLEFAFIVLIALISPGPDFAIIVKNSLVYSKRSAVYTALGIALSNLFHASYSLVGFGVFVAKYTWALEFIKYIGASYLVYIGVQCVKSKKKSTSNNEENFNRITNDLSLREAILSGFLNSLFNPKAMLFYISVFSLVIPKNVGIISQASLLFIVFSESFLWFGCIAFIFSSKKIKHGFHLFGHWVDRVIGVAMIAFGVRLFFVKMKN